MNIKTASLVLLALYVLVVRWIEKEWAPDILSKKWASHLLLGAAIAALFVWDCLRKGKA